MTQKGQVTIPREIRLRLGLNPRDKVVFELAGEVVTLRRATPKVLRWYGAVQPRQCPEDFQGVRDEFEQAVADEVASETAP
ncbi:MAG: AbrB/MazE/SpoVT family DNA-binding domain-containing protein [Chloroflexi bacterium]|nr:AbrB/MazE/SpoVT family DNA-binding domain-containing protein [Chloroflexota bacterium]MBI4506656.1 AbrB/MazE/SpoVT family DNA-binding domain-containing protein [Chloroflexota bacterium]